MKISMISFGPIESKSNGYFIRCHHIAKSLTELNNAVLVMEFIEEKLPNKITTEEGIKFAYLNGNEVSRSKISQILKNTLTFDPFQLIRFQFYSLIELIRFRDYLIDCDFVLVEGALIPFGILLSKIFEKKVILDTHCVNKLLALHFKDRNVLVYNIRKLLWDILERFTTKLSDIVIVVSERERAFIHTEYKIQKSKLFLIPNVIEIQKIDYSEKELSSLRNIWDLENKINVTFVGNLESIQNRDAVDYILSELAPYFWRKKRDVVFLILGKGKEKFNSNFPNIRFTGFVRDLPSFLEISDVCIAPLRLGSGIKTKILEYMSFNKQIVSTPLGIEGIKISEVNKSLEIVGIEKFPEKLFTVIENLQKSKAVNSRKIIEKHYSKKVMQKRLNFLLKTIR